MQRVISLQTSRNADRGSSEFVTKRFCCSFLFSVAFLSLLGGFLLGRYATDRAILLKNVALKQRQQTAAKFGRDAATNLTALLGEIERVVGEVRIDDLDGYARKLSCVDVGDDARNATHFDDAMARDLVALKTTRLLNRHLERLGVCFADVSSYLRALPHDPGSPDVVRAPPTD